MAWNGNLSNWMLWRVA